MPHITANGIELFYEEQGDRANETILLVMGLGAQMTLWPDEFVEALVDKGYHVVRYDNRDIGLSHKFEGAKAPGIKMQILRKAIRWPAKVPYSLKDMADDGMALLDALGIEKAHVAGASMGGMIAQLMAVHHPDKLLSLTSIMSTTGNPRLPRPDKVALDALTAPIPSMEEEALIEHGLHIARSIGSSGFPFDVERQRERILANLRRSVYPAGIQRQLAAIVDDGDRRARLAQLDVPALVLHGEADPLVKPAAAQDTAAAIPGAKIKTFPGWGHDIPAEMIAPLTDEIVAHVSTVNAREAA